MVIESWKPEETYELGKKLGQEANPSAIFCLNGDLGVGENGIHTGVCGWIGNQRTS